MPNPMFPWHLRDPESYQPCAWGSCDHDCSDKYPLPFCVQHILFIWSFVDADIRQTGKTPDELRAEAFSREPSPAERDRYVARRMAPQPGYVYYLEVGGLIKIGHTRSPGQRGGQYPPTAVLLAIHPGTRADERAAHKQFAAYLETGREWFMDCAEIRTRVDEINAAGSKWKTAMGRRPARHGTAVRQLRRPVRRIVG